MTQRSTVRRGDIFLVSYTFPHERTDTQSGSQTAKERPVLILQADLDNANHHYPLVLAAPLTTQKTDRIYEQDVLLPAGEANLRQESKVLLGLTQPFLKEHLGQRIGHVPTSRMRLVDVKLLRLGTSREINLPKTAYFPWKSLGFWEVLNSGIPLFGFASSQSPA